MTEPIVVTDEMRRAVYAADCTAYGHIPDYGNIFITAGGDGYVPPNVDTDQLPHIRCVRCGKVWLLVEEPGEGYDDAEARLTARLKTGDAVVKRVRDLKARRQARRAEREQEQ